MLITKNVHFSCSIDCWRCSNYISILDLTSDINGLSKDNCEETGESFKIYDLVHFILDAWWYVSWNMQHLPAKKTQINTVGVIIFSTWEIRWLSAINRFAVSSLGSLRSMPKATLAITFSVSDSNALKEACYVGKKYIISWQFKRWWPICFPTTKQ